MIGRIIEPLPRVKAAYTWLKRRTRAIETLVIAPKRIDELYLIL
jgi:hypothetical protein